MDNELFGFIAKYMPLTADEKNAITELTLLQEFKKGTVLLRENQVGNDYYFVIKGCLRCYYIIEGEERTTAFYTEQESFAPRSVATGLPSEYNVVCVEDCVLLVANPAIEQLVNSKFPRFETLCRLLSEDLLAQNQSSFDAYRNASPKQRYENLLKSRPGLAQRVPQHQLASYLGIKPESLSRIRRRLAQKSLA